MAFMTWIRTIPFGSADDRFSDQAILQITLLASWFNSIHRVAGAPGVGRE
jgi:hypothetical protein